MVQGTERRYFYRHRVPIPIRIKTKANGELMPSQSIDLSYGGLGFLWERPLDEGSIIFITVPVKDEVFDLRARVAYSERDDNRGLYHIGATFLDEITAFKARLAEQVLEIMRYRQHMSRTLRREVSEEEAATRWIERYARFFPKASPKEDPPKRAPSRRA